MRSIKQQFDAAIALLEGQRPQQPRRILGRAMCSRWPRTPTGDVGLGTTWQLIATLLQAKDPPVPVELLKPEEGATGWSDTWMLGQTQHINCVYMLG